jgi:potassium channel subfamily K
VQVGIAFIVVYFCLAIAVYKPLEGFDVMHCIYFACVIGTTVGYGDFLPSSDLSKIFTVFYIHMASITIAIVLSGVVTVLIESVLRKMLEEDQGLLIDASKVQRKQRKRFMTFVSLYVCIILIGTAYFTFSDELKGQKGSRLVNGVYLTVVTISTVGFGDLAPTTDGGRAFACFLMITGIPVFATTLGLFSQTLFGEVKEQGRMKTVRQLSSRKFSTIESLCEKMKEMDIIDGHECEGHCVTKFQYLCFTLLNNGNCSLEELKGVMDNFKELDRSGDGTLDPSDFEAYVKRKTFQSRSGSGLSGLPLGSFSRSSSWGSSSVSLSMDAAKLPTVFENSRDVLPTILVTSPTMRAGMATMGRKVSVSSPLSGQGGKEESATEPESVFSRESGDVNHGPNSV